MSQTKKSNDKDAMTEDKAELVQQLTQIQYALAQELDQGITKLKQVIDEAEKHICQAKGRYQK